MILQKLTNPSGIRLTRRVGYIISMLIILLLSVSCGQKGPLRMPEHKQHTTEQPTNKIPTQ